MDKDYTDLKKTAVGLRLAGLSYNEIKQSVDVSKSALSLWLKGVPLKPEYKKRLYTKQMMHTNYLARLFTGGREQSAGTSQ